MKSILVQQGDEVTEGAVLIELETEAQTAAATEVAAPQAEVDAAPKQDAEPVDRCSTKLSDIKHCARSRCTST